MTKTNTINLTIRDLLRPLFRQKLVIIISIALICTGVYVGLLFQTPQYEARVLMQIKGISHVTAPTYEGIGGWRIHLTQMAIVKSNPVIKRAVKALGLEKRPLDYEKNYCHPLKLYLLDLLVKNEQNYISKLSPQEKEKYLLWKAMNNLKDNISTNLQPNTDLFEITVRDYDSDKAIEIANVTSRSFTIYDLQQQLAELTLKYGELHPTVQQLQDNIYKMTENLTGKELSDLESIGTASVKIIEQASTDYRPIGRSKTILMFIGFMTSVFVGLAIAYIFDFLDQTFKSPDDIVQHLGVPSLGTIPQKKLLDRQLITDINSRSLYVEFYNELADQIFIYMKVQNMKMIMFLSVNISKVNSAIAFNLSQCLSHNMGLNTLLIDANLTKPSLQTMLKIDEMPGLVNMLEDAKMNIDEAVYTLDTNLKVMQTGTKSTGTTALINETKVLPIIKKLKNKFDVVFLDCTYMEKIPDIALLSSCVDGVVLVINEGKDHIQSTRSVLHNLKTNKATILGCILNNRTFPIPNWLYNRI